MKTKLLIFSLTAAILVFTISACGNNNSSQPAASTAANSSSAAETSGKDTLIVAMTADEGTLDPAVTMDNAAWKITYPTYERLVDYDGDSTEVKPGLAKEWKVSPDGLTWTFTLNEGHQFADGTKVDANAVKFTFDRILKIAKGPVDVFGVIQEIKAQDASTVVFTLKENFTPFLSTLAANYGGIVNPKVMEHEENGDQGQNYLAEQTMGSGP